MHCCDSACMSSRSKPLASLSTTRSFTAAAVLWMAAGLGSIAAQEQEQQGFKPAAPPSNLPATLVELQSLQERKQAQLKTVDKFNVFSPNEKMLTNQIKGWYNPRCPVNPGEIWTHDIRNPLQTDKIMSNLRYACQRGCSSLPGMRQ